MIRLIAAIDAMRGLATDKGIPWHLPTDLRYYRQTIKESTVILGYGTYVEYKKTVPGQHNFVVTHRNEPLRDGFEPVHDLDSFLEQHQGDIWVIGGASIFEQTLNIADELYLTRVEGNFSCTKFFPPFENEFALVEQSEIKSENNTSFQFEVWRRLPRQG